MAGRLYPQCDIENQVIAMKIAKPCLHCNFWCDSIKGVSAEHFGDVADIFTHYSGIDPDSPVKNIFTIAVQKHVADTAVEVQ